MSPIICLIKDIYTIEGKENIAPINPNNSDKQGSKCSKFIAAYKDRENSASKKEEIVKSRGKDLSKIGKIKYRVAKDFLYCREIRRKKRTPAQKELLLKVTWQSLPTKVPIKMGKADIHLAAKAAAKVMAKAKVGTGKWKKRKQY